MTEARTGAEASTRRSGLAAALLDWKLWLATAAVAGLLVLSLFTGVYDLGSEGGAEMLGIPAFPARSPSCWPGRPCPCPGWSCSC